MPPRKKTKPADPALAAIRTRIREAEKAQAPVSRETVALDKKALETLAACVEGGLGKKPAVLAQALAIGLQALAATMFGGSPDVGASDEQPRRGGTVVDLFARTDPDPDEGPRPVLSGLAASALGGGFAFQAVPQNVQTPSQRRREREAAGELNDDGPEDEEDAQD